MKKLKVVINAEQVISHLSSFDKKEQGLLSARYGVNTNPKTINEIAEIENMDAAQIKLL